MNQKIVSYPSDKNEMNMIISFLLENNIDFKVTKKNYARTEDEIKTGNGNSISIDEINNLGG